MIKILAMVCKIFICVIYRRLSMTPNQRKRIAAGAVKGIRKLWMFFLTGTYFILVYEFSLL